MREEKITKVKKNEVFSAMAEKRYMRFIMLMISGVLMGLTLVITKIGAVQWFAFIPLGIVLFTVCGNKKYRLRSLYGYGVFFFMCFGCVIFHWFVNLYPLDFIDGMTKGAAIAVVIAGCVGLSLLQALFGGLLFVLSAVVCRTELCKRYKLQIYRSSSHN